MEFNKFENSYNIIGNKLKIAREKANISQDKLSNQLSLLGITLYQSDIFKIEHNQRTVRDYELCALSLALNIDIHELVDEFLEKLNSLV